MTVDVMAISGFTPVLEWPSGIPDLLIANQSARGPYLEACIHGTVIHAEGDTLAAAERECYDRVMRTLACPAGPDHGPFQRGGYKNGAAFCVPCGTWFPSKMDPLPESTDAAILLADVLNGDHRSVLDILSAVHNAGTDPAAEAPVGVHRQRTKGWSAPPNTVMVDRTSKRWGNPYDARKIGAQAAVDAYAKALDTVLAGVLHGDADDETRELWSRFSGPDDARYELRQLRGKNLGCFCKLGDPCHRDILLDRANR